MRKARIIPPVLLCLLTGVSALAQTVPPLLAAIHDNDKTRVSALLQSGADVATVDEDSTNVLMYASLYASADCMARLLEKGATPNARNKIGETALMWSAHDLEKTRLLLAAGADVNAVSLSGNTPLLIACSGEGQQPIIRLLLNYGANAMAQNNRKQTCLMRVALFGDTVSARLMLDRGVDINSRSAESETALFEAVRTVNKDMIYWLIDHGADANARDSYKALPLAYAVVVNDTDIVKALLRRTIEINTPDVDGMTLLMWATYNEDDNPYIVQALLDRGAMPGLKDKNGATALDWALKKGKTATVALLKKIGSK